MFNIIRILMKSPNPKHIQHNCVQNIIAFHRNHLQLPVGRNDEQLYVPIYYSPKGLSPFCFFFMILFFYIRINPRRELTRGKANGAVRCERACTVYTIHLRVHQFPPKRVDNNGNGDGDGGGKDDTG